MKTRRAIGIATAFAATAALIVGGHEYLKPDPFRAQELTTDEFGQFDRDTMAVSGFILTAVRRGYQACLQDQTDSCRLKDDRGLLSDLMECGMTSQVYCGTLARGNRYTASVHVPALLGEKAVDTSCLFTASDKNSTSDRATGTLHLGIGLTEKGRFGWMDVELGIIDAPGTPLDLCTTDLLTNPSKRQTLTHTIHVVNVGPYFTKNLPYNADGMQFSEDIIDSPFLVKTVEPVQDTQRVDFMAAVRDAAHAASLMSPDQFATVQ